MTDDLTVRTAREWRAERDGQEWPRLAVLHSAPPPPSEEEYGAQALSALIADADVCGADGTELPPLVQTRFTEGEIIPPRGWIVHDGWIPTRKTTSILGDGAHGKLTLRHTSPN